MRPCAIVQLCSALPSGKRYAGGLPSAPTYAIAYYTRIRAFAKQRMGGETPAKAQSA